MLDDSVMFARRLRALGQPVTLRVVQDLPHGFLSLSQLCRETRQASALCTELIHDILHPQEEALQAPAAPASASLRKHRKLERTGHAGAAPYSTAQDSSSETGPEGQGGALREDAAPPGSMVKVPSPGTRGHPAGGSSAAGQPSEAGSPSDPDLAASQDAGSSGGAVGRGVGA